MDTADYVFNGTGNKLLVLDKATGVWVETTNKIPGLKLNINGNNNIIKITEPTIIQWMEMTVYGNNNKSVLGDWDGTYSKIKGLMVFITGSDNDLVIGNNFSCQPISSISMCESGLKCRIGNNVRLAGDAHIYASDAHPIIDINTNRVINYGNYQRVLTIGNGCWLGLGSFIGKNASLADYTIVAARACVTKPVVESNCIVAGNPAKIVKTGVKRLDRWNVALNLQPKDA